MQIAHEGSAAWVAELRLLGFKANPAGLNRVTDCIRRGMLVPEEGGGGGGGGDVLPQKILKIESPIMRFSAFLGLNWGQKSMFFIQNHEHVLLQLLALRARGLT